jgi:hypothetical protein
MNHQHDRREISASIRPPTTGQIKNSGPDADEGSERLVRVHFDDNYELLLHAAKFHAIHEMCNCSA